VLGFLTPASAAHIIRPMDSRTIIRKLEFPVATYIALLRKDPDSDFGVDFPDFPGCITAGSTLEETREMATEALEFHIEGMLEANLPIPEPSRLDVVMSDPENAEAIPFPVSVPDRLTGAGQVELVLPAVDLEKLDALAAKRRTTRQDVLAKAVRRLLANAKEHHAA
jgi:predicted RNase H-like HicB family nuclease